MPKPRGLPDNLRMRHDAHYVETLNAPSGTPVGRMVPIESVDPNPDQPRQALGDAPTRCRNAAAKWLGALKPTACAIDWIGRTVRSRSCCARSMRRASTY